MGCECMKPRQRLPKSPIDICICDSEDLLGYSKHTSAAIWIALRGTTEPYLSRTQMLDFLNGLALNREGFDVPTRPLHRFYSFFRRSNAYEKRKVALLGLLLGHGTAESKVDIIYQIHSAEELKQSELEKVFREMLTIALIELPSYAQYWSEMTNGGEMTAKLAKYREKLAISIPDTAMTLMRLVMGVGETAVTKENCRNRLKGDIAQSLFIARNLRWLSRDVYKRGKLEREKRRELRDRDVTF